MLRNFISIMNNNRKIEVGILTAYSIHSLNVFVFVIIINYKLQNTSTFNVARQLTILFNNFEHTEQRLTVCINFATTTSNTEN